MNENAWAVSSNNVSSLLTLFLGKILPEALQDGSEIAGAYVSPIVLIENSESIPQLLLLLLPRVQTSRSRPRPRRPCDIHELLERDVPVPWEINFHELSQAIDKIFTCVCFLMLKSVSRDICHKVRTAITFIDRSYVLLPSTSTSCSICCSSSVRANCPKLLMTRPSSSLVMLPSPSLSKSRKASRNSVTMGNYLICRNNS